MANRRSTVEFTDVTEPILSELEIAGFDIRGIINGSIIAFSRLNGDDQKEAIAEAVGEVSTHKTYYKAVAVIKDMAEVEKAEPGTVVKVLSKADHAEFEQLCKLLGPEPKKQKKKSV